MIPIILLTLYSMIDQQTERRQMYALAYRQSRLSSKPLLVIGAPRRDYPCGDVTGDIDPVVLRQCPAGGQVMDVRDIPYPDKHFGAAFISHVLEHLPSIPDCELAWRELWRVADMVYVAYPRPWNGIAIFVPDHHLWVKWDIHNPQALGIIDRHR